MKRMLSLCLAVVFLLTALPMGVATVSAATAETVNLEEVFQSNLNFLDQYYTLDPEFMINKLCGVLYPWDEAVANDFADKPMPAAEFEEVLYRYFAPTEEQLLGIRNYPRYDYVTDTHSTFYSPETGMYNLFVVGGFGGSMPERQYQRYLETEDGYIVFYAHITYDVLPMTPEIMAELEALEWPFTFTYNGKEYENGPDGYTRIASIDDYGNKYEVQYNDGILRILSQTPYTAAPESDFEYTTADGQATITNYVGAGGDVIIPATLGGCPVIEIGDSAFDGKYSVTSVVIPDSVQIIGELAFRYCEKLSVTLGNNVTTIKWAAFAEIWDLGRLVLPDSVTTIETAVFDCCGVRELVVGSGLTNLEDGSFGLCSALRSIEVSEDNPVYSSQDGVLFNKDKTVLLQYPVARKDAEYAIPDTVVEIAAYSFSSPFGWDYLKRLHIPASVTVIPEYEFYGIIGLQAFSVDAANPAYCAVDGVLFNKDRTTLWAYPAMKEDDSYHVPDGVTRIARGAFDSSYYCDLASIFLPKTVTTIDEYAFNGCGSLTDVYYGGSEEEYAALMESVNLETNEILAAATWHYNYEPVTVTPGDANGDGKVNVRDLGVMQQHLNGWEVTIELSACDVNADGKVNVRDLGVMQQHLNGWDVELK